MSVTNMSGLVAMLALIGLLTVAPSTRAQEQASVQSQCRQEAQDYGIEPEQREEYISGCVQAYGGSAAPASELEAQPADTGAQEPVTAEPDMPSADDQDSGAALE